MKLEMLGTTFYLLHIVCIGSKSQVEKASYKEIWKWSPIAIWDFEVFLAVQPVNVWNSLFYIYHQQNMCSSENVTFCAQHTPYTKTNLAARLVSW